MFHGIKRSLLLLLRLLLDHESLYSGRVFGETDSSVRAHIDDKMITANIVLPDETYHIEVNNDPTSILLNFDFFLVSIF